MNTRTRIRFLFSLAAALCCGPALSLAQIPGTGTLTGRVNDAVTHLALSGTRVSVTGTSLTTYADQAGDYFLSNVPAGGQLVQFSYVGYPAMTLPAEVAAGGATTLNAAFQSAAPGGDTVRLEEITITGEAVGQARAINQQRAADTLTHIVAADEIGRFPDQNAAESMQRIPGLALYRDQGEGRFIVVRGIRPDLNGVQLNGIALASPDRAARTMPLDVLPSDALGAVEVTKVPTPDQDADGLGGRVNMKTRSAFDAEGGQYQVSAQGQYNRLRDRLSGKYNATFANVFNQGRLGIIFSPTWQGRRFGSDNVEVSNPWVRTNIPGTSPVQQAFFNQDINYREYEITRTRYGANGAIELRPDAGTRYYFRAIYSHFVDAENRYVTTIPFSEGTVTALTDTSATVTGVRRENKQLRARSKGQDLYAYSVGAEKTWAGWRFDARAAFSEGDEDRTEESVVFRKSTRGTDWSYSFAPGVYAPVVTQVGGPAITDPTLFNEFNQLRSQPSTAYEKESNAGANLRRDFSLGDSLPAYVKVGAQVRTKKKFQDRDRINWTAPASFTFASLAQGQSSSDYAFMTGPRYNAQLFTQTFTDNKAAFTPTPDVTNSLGDDWTTRETVTAGYAMGGVTVGAGTLSGGVRWEHTEFKASGNTLRTTSGVITPSAGSRSRSYDNYLPTLNLRTALADGTVLRAAWSSSLARPQFGDSAFRRTVNDDSRTVTESNPGLKALTSVNYDVSAERYFQGLGMLSVAGFYKDIKNFTYQTTLPGVSDPETGYALTTFVNGPRGRISGLEFAWQQQLRFLPAPFDGLGLQANYTVSGSSATYLRSSTGTFENAEFIGQSRQTGNLSLSYDKHRLFLRAALNYRSPRLREDEPIGASAAEDRYVDMFRQVDLTGSYQLSSQLELFGEVLNLTNEPFRVAFGDKRTRFLQFEEYGWSANFGVRWKY